MDHGCSVDGWGSVFGALRVLTLVAATAALLTSLKHGKGGGGQSSACIALHCGRPVLVVL